MVFLVGGANSASDAYQINNSVRFNVGDSPHLERTPSSTGDEQKWTFSTWVKRCDIRSSTDLTLISAFTTNSSNRSGITLRGSGDDFKLQSFCAISGTANNGYNFETSQAFRDPCAWYHIIVATDTTQGTNTDGIKMYLNGSQITSFGATTYNQNINTQYNTSSSKMQVGARADDDAIELDGYLADTYWIDGSQLTPSSFGETNDNGVWIPKKYTGSYGTNGFKLEYQQTGTGTASASTIGADTSGNDNHLTSTNLTAQDICTDTPTNNFATLNPLIHPFSQTNYTMSEGNCKYVTGLNQPAGVSTMAMANGKWYWELKKGSTVDNPAFGVVGSGYGGTFAGESYGDADSTVIQAKSTYIENGDRIGYSNNGSDVYKNGSAQSYGSFDAIASGDIFMVALDMDNLKIYIGNNGTWLGSGDHAAGSNHVATLTDSSFYLREEGSQLAAVDSPAGQDVDWEINFGNPSFSISSGNSDANGYGNFEYAVPSGFYALCTKNLAEYG